MKDLNETEYFLVKRAVALFVLFKVKTKGKYE